jgi:hypothetical protein
MRHSQTNYQLRQRRWRVSQPFKEQIGSYIGSFPGRLAVACACSTPAIQQGLLSSGAPVLRSRLTYAEEPAMASRCVARANRHRSTCLRASYLCRRYPSARRIFLADVSQCFSLSRLDGFLWCSSEPAGSNAAGDFGSQVLASFRIDIAETFLGTD